MKIILGCDHGGINLKNAVIDYLESKNIEYDDVGCFSERSVDYPIYAYKVATAVADNKYDFGILCCGTGIGVSMAANKVKGVRAAVVSNEFGAEMTRRHNNANVLCMGGRVIREEDAVKYAEIFLNTPFSSDEERHTRRVKMLAEIDNGTFSVE